jgi:hypothetical protein
MDTLLGIAVGIGLSAACGFRVFLPLLALNLASLAGQIHLSPQFAWIGSYYATVAFGTATLLEVLAYYTPWLDHVLDIFATPAAMIAGTITTASMSTTVSPFHRWALAIIAGGGVAGLMQGTTVALRAKSSLATAGAGNPVIATLESIGSIIIVLLAIFFPILCGIVIVCLCLLVMRKLGRLVFGKQQVHTPSGQKGTG